jgi:hypothetical protein
MAAEPPQVKLRDVKELNVPGLMSKDTVKKQVSSADLKQQFQTQQAFVDNIAGASSHGL